MGRDLTLKTDDQMAVVTVTDIRGELSSRVVMQLEQLEQQIKGMEVTET